MRKNKLTVLLLVLLIACLCMTLIACNDDDTIPSKPTILAPDDSIPDVEYQVKVLYPDLKPVVGIEVQLFLVDDDSEAFCGATTGSDGIALLNTSKGLEYFVVLNGVPEGYVYEDTDFISEYETSKTVIIESALQSNKYDIYVVSEGGMPMKDVTVSVKNGEIVSSKVTGEDGIANIKVSELGEYPIELAGLPTGYSIVGENPHTTATSNDVTITVKSEVIKGNMPLNYSYTMDDIMYDFSVETSDGSTFTLSEVLKEKDFVMINFWATWCSPCKEEFDDIQAAYERYQDNMAIIAISTSDSMESVINFKASYSPRLTFDMATDQNSLYSRFVKYSGGAIPTSIFVDRYGKICNYLTGGGKEELFKQEFARYTAEDYVQVAYDPSNDEIPVVVPDKPTENMPASSEIVNKISPDLGGSYSERNDGTIWPWYLKKDGNDDILYAGNIGHNSTESIVEYTFKLSAGQFLTFDYFMNTENIGNADIMSVYIDGDWMCDLDRVSNGWQTMYLYTPLSDQIDAKDVEREHTLTLYYVKDASDGVYLNGEELVAVKNIRAVDQADLKGDVNVLRPASWNLQEVDGVKKYTSFITPVYNEKDGYYHVNTSDGPYLLANLGAATHYLEYSVSALAEGGYFELAGIHASLGFITDGIKNPPANSYVEYHKGYAWIAKNSNLPNYCYVDKKLMDTLDVMVEAFKNTKVDGEYLGAYYKEGETWLELCYYVDNYHGEGIGNIIEGICNKEAIEAFSGDKDNPVANHVVIDRTLVPRGIIHKFTPTVSGAYKVYSVIPKEYASQQGGYVHITGEGWTKSEDAIGDFEQYVTFNAGKTYYIGVAFDTPSSWGELDFYIEYIGASYDYFSPVTDGTYTYIADEDGNPIYDKKGQIQYIINKYDSNLEVGLGEDGYYHQKLADGSLDMGDNSFIWIALSQENVLLDSTIKALAQGKTNIDGMDVNFFDFTSDDGEDWSEYILERCAESEKNIGETWGMVKADANLVNILKQALGRTDHDSDDSWLGLAFYHEHLGTYPAE